MISSANFLCVLLAYLIESLISPRCSYEFNVVYVQREKYSICYTTTTYDVPTFKNNKHVWLDARQHQNRKDDFGTYLGLLSPNFSHKTFFGDFSSTNVRHCPKLQFCAISRKTNAANLRKWQKPQFRAQIFFMSFTSTS